MPQVWGLKPRLVSKSSALLRALSVHVDSDSGSGEEESCREESEGFLNWLTYRHQTVRATGWWEGDGKNSKVMVLSNKSSSEMTAREGRGYKHDSSWASAVKTKEKGQDSCEKQGWAQIVRRCWKAVLIYWKAFSTWPSLEMDPRIFHREADKSPIRNQGMLFNQSISFEMFHCLLLTTGVTIFFTVLICLGYLFPSLLATQLLHCHATGCTDPSSHVRDESEHYVFVSSLSAGKFGLFSSFQQNTCLVHKGSIYCIKLQTKTWGREELVESGWVCSCDLSFPVDGNSRWYFFFFFPAVNHHLQLLFRVLLHCRLFHQ